MIDFEISDTLSPKLEAAARAALDFTEPMLEISALMETEARLRFETGTDPAGHPWRPSVRAQATGGKTLVDHGHLLGSIVSASDAHSAIAGTNLVYAAIHQFGGPVRGRQSATSANVPKPRAYPARPFMGFSDYETGEIERILADHIHGALQ